MIRRTAFAALVVLGALGASTVAGGGPASASTPGVSAAATTPQGPIPSGIGGVGYYAAFSTVSAVNGSGGASLATTLQVQVPVQTGTANFAVTADAKKGSCKLRVKRSTQTWTCRVPALAAGSTADVATIVGSESSTTGLPTTVGVRVVGPDGNVVPLSWQWVLPYSHLTATWSGLPTAVDWGAPTSATLTIHNDGIWPSASPTVAIRPTDPAQFQQGWMGVSQVSGYATYYCGWDASSGSPDGLGCTLDPIAPGGSQTITVTAYPSAPAGGPLSLTAADSTGDFQVTSPSVGVTGTGADLTLTVSNPPSVEAGTTFPRTYTITNSGSTEALGVQLTDQSPVFAVGTTSGPGACHYFSAYRVGGRINCSFGTIPAESSVTLVAQLTAPSGAGSFSYGTYGSTSSATTTGGLNLAVSTFVSVFVQPATNVDLPVLSGTGQVGQTLTATWGTWSGTGTISLWAKLCHSGGTGCSSDIASTYTNGSTTTGSPSSTAFTYVIPPSDVGTDLVLYVSASNNGGQTAVTTTAIGPIAP